MQPPDLPESVIAAGSPAGRALDGNGTARAAAHRGHAVQFYEDAVVLAGAVADFLAAGLAEGQSIVAIAGAPCREALEVELRARGLEPALAAGDGRVILADARETLTTFMDGAVPNQDRFDGVLGGLIDTSIAASSHDSVRVFGEMVDLLWKDGNADAAIRVEELWNRLATSRRFSLLCGYEMSNFRREQDAEAFRRICGEHERVVPAESYSNADDAARMREIGLLQQRARSLEYEIEQRKELERQLRSALAERGRAEEMARAANLAKSEFLAVMSHELRTPLNAIGGHIQLIEMELHGPITSAQRDALARAQANQRHLLALINDVLNLVRIETGRLEYTIERIDLRSLLDDVVAMIEPLLREKRLECGVVLCPAGSEGDAAVHADIEKVQQIVLNLLTNSIKFTPAGGLIEVMVGEGEDPGVLHIRVRDTGSGIPAAQLEQVFDPFVQAAPRSTGQREGVGLGLAISRDLARGMGGDLSAESVVGEGTTMTLTLPTCA